MFTVIIILICVIVVLTYWIYYKSCLKICKFSGHLVGKVVIVTGANSGIGFETAKDLAQRGARLILACRNLELGTGAKEEIINCSNNKDVILLHLDLQSFASVRKFVDEVNQTEVKVDILINNAGSYTIENLKTEDGLLLGMQINYFGPFLLTVLLLPLLKESESSRIVNVSSYMHRFGRIDLEDLNREMTGCVSKHKIYFNAKLCNVLMTVELARRLKGTSVTANCLHPGVVNTQMIVKLDILLVRWILKTLCIFFKTPWEGAQTTIFLAVSPEVQKISGCYFENCQLKNLSSRARNLVFARKLCEITEKLVLVV